MAAGQWLQQQLGTKGAVTLITGGSVVNICRRFSFIWFRMLETISRAGGGSALYFVFFLCCTTYMDGVLQRLAMTVASWSHSWCGRLNSLLLQRT